MRFQTHLQTVPHFLSFCRHLITLPRPWSPPSTLCDFTGIFGQAIFEGYMCWTTFAALVKLSFWATLDSLKC